MSDPAINVRYPSGLLSYLGDTQAAAKSVEAELKKIKQEQATVIAQGRQLDSGMVKRRQQLEIARRELRAENQRQGGSMREAQTIRSAGRLGKALLYGATASDLLRGDLGGAMTNVLLSNPQAVTKLAGKLGISNVFTAALGRAMPAALLANIVAAPIYDLMKDWRDKTKQFKSQVISGHMGYGAAQAFAEDTEFWGALERKVSRQSAAELIGGAFKDPSRMNAVLKEAGVNWQEMYQKLRARARQLGRPMTDAEIVDFIIRNKMGKRKKVKEFVTRRKAGGEYETEERERDETEDEFLKRINDAPVKSKAEKTPTMMERIYAKHPFMRDYDRHYKQRNGGRIGLSPSGQKAMDRQDEIDTFDRGEGRYPKPRATKYVEESTNEVENKSGITVKGRPIPSNRRGNDLHVDDGEFRRNRDIETLSGQSLKKTADVNTD